MRVDWPAASSTTPTFLGLVSIPGLATYNDAAMASRILGIDPGTVRLGYGILDGTASRAALVAAGTCCAPARWSVARRLQDLQRQLRELFQEYRPHCVALETSYHGKNSQAMLRLGEARGMVIGLAGGFDLEVVDYSPAAVKKSVTGRGNASKDAVARLVRVLIAGVPPRSPSDTTDALAVALCHLHRHAVPLPEPAGASLAALALARMRGRAPAVGRRIR
jgi:crossover junction endodeoxyribonuclease RuvC